MLGERDEVSDSWGRFVQRSKRIDSWGSCVRRSKEISSVSDLKAATIDSAAWEVIDLTDRPFDAGQNCLAIITLNEDGEFRRVRAVRR
jgi:hypothetical protein